MLRGKAPLTSIRLADGRRANLHAGAVAPEDIDAENAERLVAEGFLEEFAVAAPEPEAEPEAEKPAPVKRRAKGD